MVKIKNIGHNRIVNLIFGMILSFAGGAVLSGAKLGGASSFADVSLTGMLSLPCAAAAFVGAAVRCAAEGTVWRNIVKLGAMSVIVSAKLFSERCSRPWGSGIMTALSVIISGAAISALTGALPGRLTFYAVYGLMSGISAFSGAELMEDIRRRRVLDLSGLTGISCGIVYVTWSAALSAMGLPLDPGLAAGTALTLGAAYFYGSAGGLIVGALTVTGAFLAAPEQGIAAAMLPAAGMLTGVLDRGKMLLSAAAFTLICLVLTIMTGGDDAVRTTFALICGAAVFLICAPHFSDKWIAVNGGTPAFSDLSAVRLGFLSDSIEAVRVDSGRISAALTAADSSPSAPSVKEICAHCYRRTLCGGAELEASAELIPTIPESCVRKAELSEELRNTLRSRAAGSVMKLRSAEERDLLNEQLKMTGELVRSLGELPTVRDSVPVSSRIRSRLESRGISPVRVTAFYNEAGRLIVGAYFGADSIPESTTRIRDLIADELGTELCIGTTVTSAKETRISLYEHPEYELEICTASRSADGTDISGDSSAVFTDDTGRSYVVLSDGMGSGKEAAVDSHIVIGMFRRLICSGMEPRTAIRLINSVMTTKSQDESFATLDAVSFDPDSCLMTSLKSGAAATILRRGSEVIRIFAPTFPVGIVRQAELSVSEYELSEGDTIIMFSDGISDGAGRFIKELLSGTAELREIVREVAERSSVFSRSEHPDDVTVIGIKVRRSRDFPKF